MTAVERRTLDDLAPAEQERLTELEQTIEAGMSMFISVGNALTEVRDSGLYRGLFVSFEDYCSVRWGISRSRAYQMIEAAEVVSTIVDTDAPLPENEAQARALAAVPVEERAEVMTKVAGNGKKPTAKAIADEHEARHPKPEPEVDKSHCAECKQWKFRLLGGVCEDCLTKTAAPPSAPPKPTAEPDPTPETKPPAVKDWPEVKEAQRLTNPLRLMRNGLKTMPPNNDLLIGLDADDVGSVDILADDLERWVRDWRHDRKANPGLRLVEGTR